MGFPRQEYWSGLPFLPPGDLPNPGIEPRSPALHVESLPTEPPGKHCACRKRTKFQVQFLLNVYHFHTTIKIKKSSVKPLKVRDHMCCIEKKRGVQEIVSYPRLRLCSALSLMTPYRPSNP